MLKGAREEKIKSEFIPGEKLYLRPLEVDDAKKVCSWMNDREVLRFLSKTMPINLFREEEFLKTLYQDSRSFYLGIMAKENDALIGMVSLVNIDTISRHAELALIIGEKEYWGKGYGTEADALMVNYGFRYLNLNKIYAHILAEHQVSLKLVKELGLRTDGVLREQIYRDGQYHDVVVCSILRKEYEALKRESELN